MESNIKVYEVSEEIIRTEEDKQRIIFNKTDDGWVYHAPNAQNHTEKQVEIILGKLKELNTNKDNDMVI